MKQRLAASGAIAKEEGKGFYVGDNVQFSIGQGLLSATPLQLAVAYGTLANGGSVMRPRVVHAILAPGTPNGKSGRVNLAMGTVLQSFAEPQVVRDIEARPEVLDPIIRGLTRVIEGPGVTSDIYHSTTGEKLFRSYPSRSLPIAGKTGTAQGAGNLPWNDSSVFGSFSKDPKQPYSVVAYLEKSGYGSRAAAPVVKCVYTALAGKTTVAKAVPADPLDTASFAVASPQLLPNPLCLVGVGSSVRD